MKKITRVLLFSAILSFASLLAHAQPSPAPTKWPSPTELGPDGFPINFSLQYDALQSYYFEYVKNGSVNAYGPAVLASPANGKLSSEAKGNEGGEVLNQLSSAFLAFRIANPGRNGVTVQTTLRDPNGQPIFAGARLMKAVYSDRDGRFGLPSLSNIELWFAEKLPPLPIPATDSIHVIGHDSAGNTTDDRWINKVNGGFAFDPDNLPERGEVILVKDGIDGAERVEKSYDIETGLPSELLFHRSNFPAAVHGITTYSDAGMTDGEISIAGSIEQGERHSPLVTLKLTKERNIRVWAYTYDQTGHARAYATSVRVRAVGSWTWSDPYIVEGASALVHRLPGDYHFTFGWPEGTFPQSQAVTVTTVTSRK